MAWTDPNILRAEIDPELPIKASTIKAILDNMTAFANQEAGAPIISNAPIVEGTSAYINKSARVNIESIPATDPDNLFLAVMNERGALNIRVSSDAQVGSNRSTITIYKNDSVIWTGQTPVTSPTIRVTFNKGDKIKFVHGYGQFIRYANPSIFIGVRSQDLYRNLFVYLGGVLPKA